MASSSESKGLGTFGGVFTPSILTILGVIMYLRLGWVVGNVGLWGTLLIVTISTAITFLTALSISAVATDQRVRTGGAYYMVSRSIGLETGGAVGIPLYFAQALSMALYTVGFAESLVSVFPALNQRWVAMAVTVAVGVLALFSAQIAIRAQYFIMAAIGLSLISLLLGGPIESTEIEEWGAPPQQSAGFWKVLAVFFPAVTGIMAGVNLSGDLKDPARSLPRGTLAAVGVGYVVYMTLPILLASRADAISMIEDTLIMRRIAFWGDAILLGVWGATLSSAVGSVLGAPRVLQALARDRILPRPLRILGRGSGPEDAPRYGTVVTLAVALTAVALGNLNVIAPVLTMFFLTTYAAVNLAAGIQQFLGSPSYRPQFRVHWAFSILGAVGCIWVMLLINPSATGIAALIVIVTFAWLERRELRAAFGDVRRGIWLAVTRAALVRLDSSPADAKNWRPHALVLSGSPTKRWHLISLAASLTHNRGLLTVATVLTGRDASADRQASLQSTIRDYLLRQGIDSMVRVITAPDPLTGVERLVGAYGLGPLVPNTIILGDSEEPTRRDDFADSVRSFYASRRNVVVVHHNPDRDFGRKRRIDVWWGGPRRNGGLMLTLAYLLRTSLEWRGADVTLKRVLQDKDSVKSAQASIQSVVDRTRTGARSKVIAAHGRPFEEILYKNSKDADLIILGLSQPEENFAEYYRKVQERLEHMPTTMLVLAAEPVAFEELLLEEASETAREDTE